MWDGPGIQDDEFETVRQLLHELTGITLGASKRDMVFSRLAKRLRYHGLSSVREYLDLLDGDPSGAERQEFINALTTNKTDFFREAHHFDYLRNTVIPRCRARGSRRLRIWSAGCSTGEEPYTLAMTLREACPTAEGWDLQILASDIDTAVLATAQRGVYDTDRLAGISTELLHKYFLRGTGANAGKVSVRPELRELITFRQLNFMDNPWPIRVQFDAIFCRNVIIYFDREIQRRLLTRFAAQLGPDGLLFLGHSESLHSMADLFTPIGGTVYRPHTTTKPASPISSPASPISAPASPSPPTPAMREHSIILGDVMATQGPAVLKTLLGSCVSACVVDPETGIGGMNHFSLPGVSDDGVNARYGAHAMELLITAVMKKGGDRSRLRAKVFGGAKVLDVVSERLNVGAKNSEFVLQYLADEGIPVDARCLGGNRGLLVRFQPHTGQAWARALDGRDMTVVVRDEERFNRDLQRRVEVPPPDAVTLF